MVVDQSLDHQFVLANFLEVNQFLIVQLMQLKKISIAQPLAFQAQSCAQALALRAHALAFYAEDLALYLPQSFQVLSTSSK
jgi:hypothetical protein